MSGAGRVNRCCCCTAVADRRRRCRFLIGWRSGSIVIAPVHPGFGGTRIPDQFDDIEDLVYLYLDLMDALDLKDTVLMGFSMGGWTAAEIRGSDDSQVGQAHPGRFGWRQAGGPRDPRHSPTSSACQDPTSPS